MERFFRCIHVEISVSLALFFDPLRNITMTKHVENGDSENQDHQIQADKNQRLLTLTEEILDEISNDSNAIESILKVELPSRQDKIETLAHLVATFFVRYNTIEGAQHIGENLDIPALRADEARQLHEHLSRFFTPFLKKSAVECAIKQVEGHP